ncbi:hypothetical protein ACQ856_29335 (plasmid) [Mycolicibacterium psychrotolerans]|uniref:hypothetical protein n=1 Tax=Mycolicibacterium psychrotolerans TaxID=216929 RepID=UPI003D67133A
MSDSKRTEGHQQTDQPGVETSDKEADSAGPKSPKRTSRRRRIVISGIVPVLALAFAVAAAFLKYESSTITATDTAAADSVSSAKEIVVQMLSYAPGTAETTLTKASDRMAGTFRQSFLSLVKDVVVPGALQKDVSATATIPAAAVTSAASTRVTLVLYIDQAIAVGTGPPTTTVSVAEVTLEKLNGGWLLTDFEPK